MKPQVLIGALVGGALGALLWAGIVYCFSAEVSLAAWAVGGLAGGGAMFAGGRGPVSGTTSAVVALVAILAGKFLGLAWWYPTQMSRDVYEYLEHDAVAFAQVEPHGYREYMIEFAYTDAVSPEEVPEDQLAYFSETIVPLLRDMHRNRPRFFAWKERPDAIAYVQDVTPPISTGTLVTENLGVLDVLFALLGIATAYRVGVGIDDGTHVPAPKFPGAVRKRKEEEEPALL